MFLGRSFIKALMCQALLTDFFFPLFFLLWKMPFYFVCNTCILNFRALRFSLLCAL